MDLQGILGNFSYHLFEVWPWKVLVLDFTLPLYQYQNLDTPTPEPEHAEWRGREKWEEPDVKWDRASVALIIYLLSVWDSGSSWW